MEKMIKITVLMKKEEFSEEVGVEAYVNPLMVACISSNDKGQTVVVLGQHIYVVEENAYFLQEEISREMENINKE